jgi:signal recognition particle subunit SRP54
VSDLNKLMKMHRQMADMMKKLGKKGGRNSLKQALGGMMGKGGGMPDMNDPRAMEEAAKAMGGRMPGGMGGGGPALPPGLSGFGKKK